MIDTRWQQVERVLAIRLDSLGDVLLTTPAIRAIKETIPTAHVTLLASPVGAEVGKLSPGIDDVIVCQVPWIDPYRLLPQDSQREMAMIQTLRERQFDGAIIFTSYHQSPLPAAYMCYLADIPLRHAATVDGGGSLLTTRHKHPPDLMHEVERGLDLVRPLGFTTRAKEMVLKVSHDDMAQMQNELCDRGIDVTKSLAVVHPGCNFQARTYPWGNYVRVADLLVERLNCEVVFTGSEDERELISNIQSWMKQPSTSMAGKTNLKRLAALVKAADIVVTNNTGPMHVAAAMKTPVVALFALTNPPSQWRPWMVPYRLLNKPAPCAYCYNRVCPVGHECLTQVTPEEVVEAAGELIEESIGLQSRC